MSTEWLRLARAASKLWGETWVSGNAASRVQDG